MKVLNKIIFNLLRQQGDNLETKKQVTHWFYFKNSSDLLRFEKYVNDIGFSTMDKHLERTTETSNLLLIG